MSWNLHTAVRHNNISYPYSTTGSFVEYVEGLTYDHVNFIFSGASHAQECSYPSSSTTNFYKSGLSEPGSTSYHQDSNGYEVNYCEQLMDEYGRHSENSATSNEQIATVCIEREGVNNVILESSIECPRRNHNGFNDYEVSWEDNIDPDNMTYEELLELGEAVGTESRGLSQEQISSIPVSKYKCGRFFFFRKKSREERCVICQMEYRRGDKTMTLPCKHAYHASCGNKWLSINKACPMCYREVIVDVSKHK